MVQVAKNTIQESSQANYINNFVQYAFWCIQNDLSYDTLPIDHFQIASYLLEATGRGLASSTIRSLKASIAWYYNCWWRKNTKTHKRSGFYEDDHPAILAIAKFASRQSINHFTYPAIAFKRQQITLLCKKYMQEISIQFIHCSILLFSIYTASRIHMIITRRYTENTGLHNDQITFIIDDKERNLLKEYEYNIPISYLKVITGIKVHWMKSKTTRKGQMIIKYIGKSKHCFVAALFRIFKYYYRLRIPYKPDNPVFFHPGKAIPITYYHYSNWLKKISLNFVAEMGAERCKRIRTHSGRKTMITWMERCGFTPQRISKYTGHKHKDAGILLAYVDIEMQEMMSLAQDLWDKPFIF